MTDYNWDQEYKDLWWDLKQLGLDPEESKVEGVSRVIFDIAWSQGFYKGAEHGYNECLEEYNL